MNQLLLLAQGLLQPIIGIENAAVRVIQAPLHQIGITPPVLLPPPAALMSQILGGASRGSR